MNYKSLLIILLFFTYNVSAQGANIGLGVALNDEIKVYLPISTSDYIIEPTISIFKRNVDAADSGLIRGFDEDVIEVGIGIFKNNTVYENTFMYYGARIGYFTSELSTDFRSDEVDGYFIMPAIGFQYYLIPKLSFGIELGLKYSKSERTIVSIPLSAGPPISDTSTSDEKRTESETEIIIRYVF